jgi:tetratricopeptide (TPR) repeat protein
VRLQVERGVILGFAVSLATAVLVLFLPSDPRLSIQPRALALNMVAFPILMYLSIVPHELGHAIGATIARLDVLLINLGQGRRVASAKLGNVLVVLRAYPTAGWVVLATASVKYWRFRWILSIAAGPAATALLILISGHMVGGASHLLEIDRFGRHFAPWQMLALANLLLLLNSLFGPKVRTELGLSPCDGRQIISLLTKPLLPPALRQLNQCVVRGYYLILAGEFERARDFLLEAQREFPLEPTIQLNLAAAELKMGHHEEPRSLILPVLERYTATDEGRALLLNNLAWADVLDGSPDRLEEADRASQMAISILPWDATVQGTRGTVLVLRNQIEAGDTLLCEAVRYSDTRDARSNQMCGLSIGESLRGNAEGAERWLRKARRLDPNSTLISRADGALAALRQYPEAQAHLPDRPLGQTTTV